jgi:hypothetical protein
MQTLPRDDFDTEHEARTIIRPYTRALFVGEDDPLSGEVVYVGGAANKEVCWVAPIPNTRNVAFRPVPTGALVQMDVRQNPITKTWRCLSGAYGSASPRKRD